MLQKQCKHHIILLLINILLLLLLHMLSKFKYLTVKSPYFLFKDSIQSYSSLKAPKLIIGLFIKYIVYFVFYR